MRPVRFVALSEDGHALVLADEMGHLLALPLDERVNGALSPDRATQLPWPSRRARRCSRPVTSRRASAWARPPTRSPAPPACRSTASCGTRARCCRSAPCSPSTPAAPA